VSATMQISISPLLLEHPELNNKKKSKNNINFDFFSKFPNTLFLFHSLKSWTKNITSQTPQAMIRTRHYARPPKTGQRNIFHNVLTLKKK
jgi:hypothetical protein